VNKDANLVVAMTTDSGQNWVGSCKVTTIMSVLNVLSSLSETLIRSEVRTMSHRSALERGIVQAIRELGVTVEEASAQTGLTVAEIHDLLDRPVPLDDLADLTGVH
jgi:DNA-directed RNA polymerase specialized sigma24 family protein